MGPVVTINSATLVNKGLEVIEAHLLFGVPYDRIDVVVHPQSIVHSMVTFTDGSTIAQASPPDMRLPIALALAWPDRLPRAAAPLRLVDGEHLGVPAAGRRRVPRRPAGPARPGEAGGVVPALYNAANEEAVPPSVAGRLSFPGIVDTRRAYPRRRAGPRRTHLRRGRPGRGEVGPGARPGRHRRRLTLSGSPADRPRRSSPSRSACCSRSACTRSATSSGRPRFGMQVTQYMVGFGPTVWSRRRGETEYGIKAIPLGGYIRIVGMIPPARRARASAPPGCARSSPRSAVRRSTTSCRPTGGRVFYAKPWWQRVIVMFAGPFHNLVLAVVFFTILLMGFGLVSRRPRSRPSRTASCRPARRRRTR